MPAVSSMLLASVKLVSIATDRICAKHMRKLDCPWKDDSVYVTAD